VDGKIGNHFENGLAGPQGIARRSFLTGALGTGAALASGFTSGFTSIASAAAPLKAVLFTSSGPSTSVFNELMKQQGFLSQMGIDADVQNVSDGSKIIPALLSGTGDLCPGAGFSNLIPAISQGAKIKILAGGALSPITCIYAKNPDVKSTKDLIGKTVGVGSLGAVLHQMVVALLIKEGLDYTKVNFRNVGSATDVFKAVVAGTIDAGPGDVDIFDQQAKYGVHSLAEGGFWDSLPEYTNQAMFASEQAMTDKRETLVRCMAAYAKMFRFVQSPDSFEAWRKARAVAVGKDDHDEALAHWKFFNKPERLAANLVLSHERIDYLQNLNVKLGVQSAVLPFEKVADMSLAQDAIKLLS
jgi:ABC-type nitrate/sulfonate/bicarbonate transport system substrate-binding protein